MSHTKSNSAIAHDFEEGKVSSQDYLNYLQEKQKRERLAKATPQAPTNFIFADEKMLRIREIIKQIADANVPVLISGESGTGKEVIARMIHASSGRKNDPFISVNCASLPPAMLESELFGVAGAQGQMGKFEQAHGGTVLLDEVTETEQGLQAKLLRALQEQEIERVGGDGAIKIDARIIATTNRDIARSVKDGRFRQDLFYRLYVIHLEIPALRDRPKDIEVLTRHFLKTFSVQFKGEAATLTADAMQKLLKYTWPGNVRELQNVIQRAVLMSQGNNVTAKDFVLEQKKVDEDLEWVKHLPIGQKMREVETQFILETLRTHNGNRTHSAKTLGISLRTLRNKINEFVLEGHEVPQPTTGKAL
ncbi:MAG: sigma-54-dependent Fis family transcriptional regulator [Chitinophagaceae bacterium]|nr:sigma-54-dependent Fis family transcriptional regulator [Oligoflexus sp.]